ncbi:hypothetical protein C8D97_104205 [Pleionea mediterranea]|uniref:Uncharacterized protein n=1 Tax=Pleionea mediterranea TaxID=523701 RepID=A0A316GEA4_9GAMM|nr:hypothetical protein C8D97_104205 [Pleionea mediterranea]
MHSASEESKAFGVKMSHLFPLLRVRFFWGCKISSHSIYDSATFRTDTSFAFRFIWLLEALAARKTGMSYQIFRTTIMSMRFWRSNDTSTSFLSYFHASILFFVHGHLFTRLTVYYIHESSNKPLSMFAY